MIVEVALLGVVILIVGLWIWRRQRRLYHLKRYEKRTHKLYMRTKRDNWVKKWLYGNRMKRLSNKRYQSSPVRTDQTL